MECPVWRAAATRLLELHKRNDELRIDPGADISNIMKLRAESLLAILQERFKQFLKKRINQKSKRDHWCMCFAYNNLPVVASMMILSGHTKSDLECLNERGSPLAIDSKLLCEMCHPSLERRSVLVP